MIKKELLDIEGFVLPDVPLSGYFTTAFGKLNSIKDIEKIEVKLDILREIVNLMSIPTDYGRLFATILAYDFDLLIKANKMEITKAKKMEKKENIKPKEVVEKPEKVMGVQK